MTKNKVLKTCNKNAVVINYIYPGRPNFLTLDDQVLSSTKILHTSHITTLNRLPDSHWTTFKLNITIENSLKAFGHTISCHAPAVCTVSISQHPNR
jgi:hypothetical protein